MMDDGYVSISQVEKKSLNLALSNRWFVNKACRIVDDEGRRYARRFFDEYHTSCIIYKDLCEGFIVLIRTAARLKIVTFHSAGASWRSNRCRWRAQRTGLSHHWRKPLNRNTAVVSSTEADIILRAGINRDLAYASISIALSFLDKIIYKVWRV